MIYILRHSAYLTECGCFSRHLVFCRLTFSIAPTNFWIVSYQFLKNSATGVLAATALSCCVFGTSGLHLLLAGSRVVSSTLIQIVSDAYIREPLWGRECAPTDTASFASYLLYNFSI